MFYIEDDYQSISTPEYSTSQLTITSAQLVSTLYPVFNWNQKKKSAIFERFT